MSFGKLIIYGAVLAVVLGGLVAAKRYSGPRVHQAPEEPSAMAEELKPSSEFGVAQASQRRSAIIKTNFGDITLELFAEDAPRTVENFANLAKSGFYTSVKFHRVIKGFMIQGGDPNSKDDDWSDDGRGGPGYTFADEINEHKVIRGALAMANAGPDTNGSQFFIVTADAAPWLDGKHTVFGQVTNGMETVDTIESVPTDKTRGDHPIADVIITAVEVGVTR